MAGQPIPIVSDDDVERILQREFAAVQVEEVRAMLDENGTESSHREPVRVRLAALRISAGCVDALRSQIEMARRDYRDVIGPAEYPGYSRQLPENESISPDELRGLIDNDWKQYQDWLKT